MISSSKVNVLLMSLCVRNSLEYNQDHENPNVLVPTKMLRTELKNREIVFSDWESDWIGIDNFYCRSFPSDCQGCGQLCNLMCQNYGLTLSVSINSWNQCDYPYGFANDTRLSGEQQAIIAIIFLLATIFVIISYHVIRSMTASSNFDKKDAQKKDKSDHSNSESIMLKTFNIPPSFLNEEKFESPEKAVSPPEKNDTSNKIHNEAKIEDPSKIKSRDVTHVYTPVILSVK